MVAVVVELSQFESYRGIFHTENVFIFIHRIIRKFSKCPGLSFLVFFIDLQKTQKPTLQIFVSLLFYFTEHAFNERYNKINRTVQKLVSLWNNFNICPWNQQRLFGKNDIQVHDVFFYVAVKLVEDRKTSFYLILKIWREDANLVHLKSI